MNPKSFEIKGNNGLIRIEIIQIHEDRPYPSPTGGFDCTCRLQLSNDGFSVDSEFYSYTGQFKELFKKLTEMYAELEGTFTSKNYYERNLEMKFVMITGGHLSITGQFSTLGEKSISLDFDIDSDQSYLPETLNQLKAISEAWP